MRPNEAVLMLAGRIQEMLTEECLAWGEAINRAEAEKATGTEESYAALVMIAREHGRRVAQLSAGIAAKLRPG